MKLSGEVSTRSYSVRYWFWNKGGGEFSCFLDAADAKGLALGLIFT